MKSLTLALCLLSLTACQELKSLLPMLESKPVKECKTVKVDGAPKEVCVTVEYKDAQPPAPADSH